MKNTKKAALLAVIFATAAIISGCGQNQEKTAVKEAPKTEQKTTQKDPSQTGASETASVPKGTKLGINMASSAIEWEGKKVTGKHNGTVNLKNGELYVEGDKITGGSFDIDFTTIKVLDLADAETNGKLTGHLKSDDFFGAAKFPTGNFTVSSVEPVKDDKGNNMKVRGTLTIKGIANEVSFPAKINMESGKVNATADFSIDRTKWDIKYGSGKFFENLGDKMINDEFSIRLKLTAGA